METRHNNRVSGRTRPNERKTTPLSQRRSPTKTKSTFWRLKTGILDEKRENNRVYYLVDWEDDLETGESYPPSWVPFRDITSDVITRWQNRKRGDSEKVVEETTQSAIETSPDSQSVPPAKRRRTLSRSPTTTTNGRSPRKRPRKVGTAESARFQSVSQETLELESSQNREIPDSYEDDKSSAHLATANLQVEILVHDSFDRGAYSRVLTSSQLSQTQQQPIYESQQRKSPAIRGISSVIWDEDIEGVIPDSQEPGSSSYQPSETRASNVGTSGQDTHSEPDIETIVSSESRDSGNIESVFAEPAGTLGTASYIEELSSNSIRGDSSGQGTSGPEPIDFTQLGSQNFARRLDASSSPPKSVNGQATDPSSSSELLLSSERHRESIPAHLKGTWPEEGHRIIPELQPFIVGPETQYSQENSSPIFQTQLPPLILSTGSAEGSPEVHRQSILQTYSISSPDKTPSGSPRSSRSQLHVDTRRSLSKSQEDLSLGKSQDSSSHLPSPPLERELSSPEQFAQIVPGTSLIPSISDATSQETSASPLASLNMEERATDDVDSILDARILLKRHREERIAEREAAKQQEEAKLSATPSPGLVTPSEALASPVPEVETNAQAVAFNQMLPIPPVAQEQPVLEEILDIPSVDVDPSLFVASGRAEYTVPLPIVTHVRDIYLQTIRNYRDQRYTFLTEDPVDPNVVAEIDLMIEELERLCDHQDLITGDFSTQRMDPEETQAKWAENVSTKCIFIAELLKLLRPIDKRITILVRPGRMLEILEALLRWHGFNYRKAEQSASNSYVDDPSKGPLRITLVPAESERFVVEPASAVIAFDSTSSSMRHLDELRADPASPNRLVPLISLIVTHSVEHLERCLGGIDPIERKIKLVGSLTQIGDSVGKLDSNYHDPPAAAQAVAEYLAHGTIEQSWPLFPMPDIDGLDLDNESQQPEPKQPLYDISSSAQGLQPNTKRQLGLEDIMNPDSPKRQKLSPTPIEASQVSDDILLTSLEQSDASATGTEKTPAKIGSPQDLQVSSLLKRISELELNLRTKESNEARLRQVNQTLESRCQDYESSINAIQPKYQEALNDRGRFEYELNLSTTKQANLQKERDAKEADVIQLREQKSSVEAELASARAALVSSTIPEAAELGILRDELVKSRAETERLQKRLANMQNDLEYIRQNYQVSSNRAAESAAENTALTKELEEVRIKANENTVRIHAIQNNEQIKQNEQRIRQLTATKEELERELEKKDNELRALTNGRRSTRGASVPRSPRMGTGVVGTMSPGPARSIGRVLQTGGSRGNSPVPGEFGGPGPGFRGMAFSGEGMFGEALRGPPGPSGVRWGNHLQ